MSPEYGWCLNLYLNFILPDDEKFDGFSIIG